MSLADPANVANARAMRETMIGENRNDIRAASRVFAKKGREGFGLVGGLSREPCFAKPIIR